MLFGGSGWIRTTEARRSRFTVCPLWPLGNTPIFDCVRSREYFSIISKKKGECKTFFCFFGIFFQKWLSGSEWPVDERQNRLYNKQYSCAFAAGCRREIRLTAEKHMSGCSAVGSAPALGSGAERSQWRMQRGEAGAEVKKENLFWAPQPGRAKQGRNPEHR